GDVGGFCKRIADRVLISLRPVEGDIVWNIIVNERLAAIVRRSGINDGVKLVEINLDKFGRVLGLIEAFGDDKGDIIADMAYLFRGENWMAGIGPVAPVAVLERDHAGELVGVIGFQLAAEND